MSAPLTGDALVGAFVAAWSTADPGRVAALYAPDAVVDLTVPHGRVRFGTDELESRLAEGEFLPGYRVETSAGRATADGAVVELEARFRADGGEGMFREVHLLRTGERGITEHVGYCSGVTAVPADA